MSRKLNKQSEKMDITKQISTHNVHYFKRTFKAKTYFIDITGTPVIFLFKYRVS